jgi:hypothetical protein
MHDAPSKLLGLRALHRHLKSRLGDIDPNEIRSMAERGEIPAVRLPGSRKGHAVFGFDPAAVEAALLERARQALGEKGGSQ